MNPIRKAWLTAKLLWHQPQAKASDVLRLIYLMTNGQPQWTPRQYERLATEGYQTNVTVYDCVRAICRAAAGIPWKVFTEDRQGKHTPLEDRKHPLVKLMRRPNQFQGTGAFIETVFGFWLLAGNSYINLVAPSPQRAPMELWGLRPDRMQVIPDRTNMIGGYRYQVSGNSIQLGSEQILHLKFFHPTNDWYGLSPLEVAARVVDTDNEGISWNMSLLQNSARPSGALVATNSLSEEQFTKLKKEMDDLMSSPKNAGRPMLLEGGLDWKEMGLNPKDMDWLAGRKLTKREIAQAYGVPPEIIGDAENKTFSNFQEARKAFYTETVLPLCDLFVDEFNTQVTPRFGENLLIAYDKNDIEALQEDRNAQWTRINSATFLTINEKREELGLEAIDDGDVILVPTTMVPLETAVEEPGPVPPQLLPHIGGAPTDPNAEPPTLPVPTNGKKPKKEPATVGA